MSVKALIDLENVRSNKEDAKKYTNANSTNARKQSSILTFFWKKIKILNLKNLPIVSQCTKYSTSFTPI